VSSGEVNGLGDALGEKRELFLAREGLGLDCIKRCGNVSSGGGG